MKKNLSYLIAGLLWAGLAWSDIEPGYDTIKDATAVKTNEIPVIDGTIDTVWDQAAWNEIATFVQDGDSTLIPPAGEADLSGRWKALWDTKNLYVLAEVKDDALVFAPNNSLEIFTSTTYTRQFGQYGNPGYNGSSDYQIMFATSESPETTFGLYSFKPSTNTIVAKFKEGPGGYVAEVKLPWIDLGGDDGDGFNDVIMGLDQKWQGKWYMGFEILLRDDDDGGNRDTKLVWAGGPPDQNADISWAATSVWGTLWLAEEGVVPTGSIFKAAPDGCSTLFGGGWAWNSAWGFIYDGYYPFVYSSDTGAWIYVFPNGTPSEQLYWIYNFKTGKFAWTGCPYYPGVYEL